MMVVIGQWFMGFLALLFIYGMVTVGFDNTDDEKDEDINESTMHKGSVNYSHRHKG